ncbi:MAG: hypothetical protein M3N29_02560 [Chloroflexota bacterium]|nr:hypothetical protein [Chloroflexota bacterium]
MDELARDYLRLALAAGTHYDGIVDAYYGPAELRVEAEAGRGTPAALAEQAAELRERLSSEADAQRRRWLDRQLVALETILRRLAGEEMDYLDEVERCFDARPAPTDPGVYEEVHRQLDELLPAGGDLRQRVEQRAARLTVQRERLPAILDLLVDEIRDDCVRHFPAPAGESLTISLVNDQPWSAYNWYDGDLRSRVEVNTDLPVRAPELIALLSHECFPGHHLEHAWKEQRLYREQGRAEVSVQLINTPEAFISEGLAELGRRLVISDERWQELLAGICERAGIALEDGELPRQQQISRALHGLRGAGGDASLLLHAERRPPDEVTSFVERVALRTREQAAKTLQFIRHPLWRTYVFCYAGGERLLADWCAAAGDEEAQRGRFFRLLTEQLTPSHIASEVGAPTP